MQEVNIFARNHFASLCSNDILKYRTHTLVCATHPTQQSDLDRTITRDKSNESRVSHLDRFPLDDGPMLFYQIMEILAHKNETYCVRIFVFKTNKFYVCKMPDSISFPISASLLLYTGTRD